MWNQVDYLVQFVLIFKINIWSPAFVRSVHVDAHVARDRLPRGRPVPRSPAGGAGGRELCLFIMRKLSCTAAHLLAGAERPSFPQGDAPFCVLWGKSEVP